MSEPCSPSFLKESIGLQVWEAGCWEEGEKKRTISFELGENKKSLLLALFWSQVRGRDVLTQLVVLWRNSYFIHFEVLL